MKPQRYILRTSGQREELPAPVSMKEIHRLIDAQVLDTVALHHLGEPLHVMLLDDLGYETAAITDENATLLVPLTAKKPVNAEATRLYHANCRPGTTHQIVGDVVIVPDEDYAP